MIVDLREPHVAPRMDQLQRDAANIRANQQQTALDIEAFKADERENERRLVAQELESDRVRMDTIRRNTRRVRQTAAEQDVPFTITALEEMTQELLREPGYLAIAQAREGRFQGVEFEDAYEMAQSPEFAQLFDEVLLDYNVMQAQRAGEAKASGLERIASVAEDPRAGIGQEAIAELMALAEDESVSAAAFDAHVGGLMQTAKANVGFFDAKESVKAEAAQVWDSVRTQLTARDPNSLESITGGERPMSASDLMLLKGEIEFAQTPEELKRARDNFIIKAQGLDGAIDEAENRAYNAGLEAMQEKLRAGGVQFDRSDRFAAPSQAPEQRGMLAAMEGRPHHEQVVVQDMIDAGLDPTDPGAVDEHVRQARQINPYYGMGPNEEAVERLRGAGGNDEEIDQLEGMLASGANAQDALEQVGQSVRDRVEAPRRQRENDLYGIGLKLLEPLRALTNNQNLTPGEAAEMLEDNAIVQGLMGIASMGDAVASKLGSANKAASGAAGRTLQSGLETVSGLKRVADQLATGSTGIRAVPEVPKAVHGSLSFDEEQDLERDMAFLLDDARARQGIVNPTEQLEAILPSMREKYPKITITDLLAFMDDLQSAGKR